MINNKSIYIAGPMRGYHLYNFPAFDKARDEFEGEGWSVVSPADIDRDNGFDPINLPADFDWNDIPDELELMDCIDRDLKAVKECDAILMLDGWRKSLGATAERAVAKWAMKEVFYEAV